jgi:hypothetical protein
MTQRWVIQIGNEEGTWQENDEAKTEILGRNLPDVTEEEQEKITMIGVSRLTVHTSTQQNTHHKSLRVS